MLSNSRKTVAVILEGATGEFQKRLCDGISTSASRLGYNVAVFNAFGKYGEGNEDHFFGDQMIYNLVPWEEVDGVILALDTLNELSSRERVLYKVREFCHCPVVSVREKVEGANNLIVDNLTCMEGIVRHFIEHHGFTRLCFMTGPKGRWDAEERLQCFERIMKEHGLPVDEHQRFYGDFWTNMGKEACDWFLDGQEKPEVILCANDHMAQAVASELIGRDFHIPDDICVSGYDGMFEGLGFSPTLSTMEVPFYDMGVKAVELIDAKQEQPQDVADYYFQPELALRESCGCSKTREKELLQMKRTIYEHRQIAKNREVQFDYLAINLVQCSTLEEVGERLSYYQYNIDGLSNYALCFCDNIYKEKKVTEYPDRMITKVAFKEREYMGIVEIPFDRRKQLIPDIFADEEPQVWFFAPIHFLDNCYGYEAMSFPDPARLGNLYFSWNTNIGNKIHDMLMEEKMQALISQLEEMYDRDALTGMYNRWGWGNYGNAMFNEARENGETIFMSVVDMDGMKQINDNYGHEEGDFALKKIREAIELVCEDNYISARTGGDEFVVMAKGITPEMGGALLERLEQFLGKFNASSEKEYDIHASFGYVCRIPAEGDTLETMTKESDEAMYENKVSNKKRRGEALR